MTFDIKITCVTSSPNVYYELANQHVHITALMYMGHFFNMATIQENVTLLHSTALALNAM